ncbi:HD domain-containing phosphohydrolase [Pseudoalteromonas sp. T1lg88]|uniref:HD domain-containing phosphohydrolase n=1 Tax=Pseudoalteromonas sp. T1lg88 TaxID=2077104 RepID=UPI000CF61E21|nr:HD domain-containing phosphohydrolase [Pseudoalteromonas sp. T1lg88]
MDVAPKRTRFTIRVTLITSFVVACAFTALVAIGLQFVFSNNLAKSSAQEKFQGIAANSSEQALLQEQSALGLARSLKHSFGNRELSAVHLSKQQLLAFSSLLEGNPKVFSLFIGFANGDYLELSNLESARNLRQLWGAAPSDRWVLLSISEQRGTRGGTRGGTREQTLSYLNSDLSIRHSEVHGSKYNASTRPWFKLATRDKVYKMPPYLFNFVRQPGSSYSIKSERGDVFGTNILLSSLAEYMAIEGHGQGAQAYMFDDNGVLRAQRLGKEEPIIAPGATLSLSGDEQRLLQSIGTLRVGVMDDYPPFEYNLSGQPRGYGLEHLQLIAAMLGLELELINGYSFPELIEQLKQGQLDMLLGLMKTEQRLEFGAYAQPYYLPEVVFATANLDLATRPQLASLATKRIAAQRGYAITRFLRQQLPQAQFIEYKDTLTAMRALERGEVDAVFDLKVVLQYIEKYFFIDTLHRSAEVEEFKGRTEFGLHHFVRQDLAELIPLIDKAQAELEPQILTALEQKWLRFDGQDHQGTQALTQVPSPKILALAKDVNSHNKLHSISLNGEQHLIYVSAITGLMKSNSREYLAFLVSERQAFAQLNTYVRNAIIITLAVLALVLLLITQLARAMASPIQRLIEENQKISHRNYNEVHYVSSHIEEIHQLSQSLVNMSESICDFEAGQKELLDSFIQLIAQAIDEKSPYTGGHCARVPELALMLAHHAHESQTQVFADFRFRSQEQWREFEVAAWLHDCGKITTPEHIVDKGSKLECIYNRIHELRMRFEVLLRDAEISYLHALQAAPEDKKKLASKWQGQRREIMDDFEFIARCNIGGEAMAEEDIARLHKISERTWYRTLSDRVGLSPAEQRHMEDFAPFTPGFEAVLSDKPEHIYKRQRDIAARDKGFGFNMKVPENKQNLGELTNLSITRGTLTDEDRYIINEHITTTIRMLETLPLPQELARVPEYAGGHHEKLDGKGYPRGLRAEQMSIPAKIMAIADIFEALTANDRPYKQAKTLSQALKIMKRMVADEHIDRDLFNLFLTENVYLAYAEQFLLPEQIDAIDINDYLSD